jgi:hypothetical protein
MLNTLAFANTFGLIVLVLHPLIFFAIKTWPKKYVWLVHISAFGIVPHLGGFDMSVRNMVIGTVVKAILFWCIGLLGASVYNFLTA